MKEIPAKHVETYSAWKKGASIQIQDMNGKWFPCNDPSWIPMANYRVQPDAPDTSNTAPDFLHRAATIMEERGKQYDKPGGERSMGKTVAAFNAITGQDMTQEQGWQFMMVLKSVRFFSNTTAPHRDSLEDAIAYSALLAESALKGE